MAKTIGKNIRTADQNMLTLLGKVQDALSDVCLTTAGLAIGTGSKKKVKVVTIARCVINCLLKSVAAGTEIVLAGTVTNAKFNVFVLYATDTDTAAAAMGTEAATLAAVAWPVIPANAAVLGILIVNPTGTGNFVGGSAGTDLDDATVVPNAVYINTPYPVNMNVQAL